MELLSPSVVLASYSEPLLDGRRAIVFGDSTSPLAEEMIGRGARSVHVCDPEPARAGEAAARNRSRQISIVPHGDADVAVREGAFDVAIVEDLSSATDAVLLLGQVRRALSPRGVAFVASPNPDAKRPLVPRTTGASAKAALGYYELYDKVVAEFPEVRMLGQTPFVGYAIVDFAPASELEVELDSGFLPTGAEEPEWFVAVAARGPVELGAFSIVQLPATRVVGAGTDGALAEDLRASRAAEARLGEKLATAEAENARLKAERQSKKATANERSEELRAEIEARDGRIVDLEARKAAAETGLKEATAVAETLRERAAEADRLTVEHAALRADRDGLAKALDEAKAETSGSPEPEAEVAKLEAVLGERGERIRKLEADLAEAERIGKELVKDLAREIALREAATSPGETKDKLEHLDTMASENARLRADVQALEWTVQELENRLDHAMRRASESAPRTAPETGPPIPQAEPDVAR
jgi:hypothetical protein